MAGETTRLLELARMDARLREIRQEMEEQGQAVDLERRKIERQRAILAARREEAKRVQGETGRLDLDLRTVEEKILKLALHQNTARTNEEFSALGREMQAAKETGSAVETRILEGMTRLDEIGAEIKVEEQRRKDLEAHLGRVEQEVARQEAATRALLAKLTGERETLRASLSGEAVQRYERVLSRHGDAAVAAVAGDVCQGCYMSVTPQHVNLLLRGEEVVYCNACNRILYLPDRIAASMPRPGRE